MMRRRCLVGNSRAVRAPAWLGALVLFASSAAPAVGVGTDGDRPVDFAHDVVPVLRKHCVACHGGKESKGGFSLNTRALILDAEAAEPGNAQGSWLMELVTSNDPDEQMPPKKRPRP